MDLNAATKTDCLSRGSASCSSPTCLALGIHKGSHLACVGQVVDIRSSATPTRALLLIGVGVVLALWLLPKWQVARSQGLSAENRFDRENEARKTLAQIIGGVFVLAGLYSSLPPGFTRPASWSQ